MPKLSEVLGTPLPNMRKIFLPDPGKIIFDIDLAGADAQVVAWEAGDQPLKDAFRAYQAGKGPKVHCVNAKAIFGERAGADGKKEPFYTYAKMGTHLTNYGGSPRTCAQALKISTREAEYFQASWFTSHPAIKEWHSRVERSLNVSRAVMNPFGFTKHYFDRPDGLLAQALAWVPQSTVAIVINTIFNRISRELPEVEILLQVHDSLVGQAPIDFWPLLKKEIFSLGQVEIPYANDPLVIPLGLKTSLVSWGDCQDEEWGG